MTRFPDGFDVEGPVQAEVFVVWLARDHLELTGPCGPAPWLLELGNADHPVEVVTRIVRDAIGEPTLVHSTSWRRDRAAVILSFVVVIDEALVGSMTSLPIARSALARGEATAAPRTIATAQVVEHGLRHMAWLAKDDPAVAAELPATTGPEEEVVVATIEHGRRLHNMTATRDEVLAMAVGAPEVKSTPPNSPS